MMFKGEPLWGSVLHGSVFPLVAASGVNRGLLTVNPSGVL